MFKMDGWSVLNIIVRKPKNERRIIPWYYNMIFITPEKQFFFSFSKGSYNFQRKIKNKLFFFKQNLYFYAWKKKRRKRRRRNRFLRFYYLMFFVIWAPTVIVSVRILLLFFSSTFRLFINRSHTHATAKIDKYLLYSIKQTKKPIFFHHEKNKNRRKGKKNCSNKKEYAILIHLCASNKEKTKKIMRKRSYMMRKRASIIGIDFLLIQMLSGLKSSYEYIDTHKNHICQYAIHSSEETQNGKTDLEKIISISSPSVLRPIGW